ncbi:protein rmd5 homolog a [Phtheirospermum japonicum]|uniref:Protein rmd5 homolog a n=1 Tax=Phtheirospermum japonicum TaxID=374723 RepID=A0A830BHJ3_9LAMI|nr:protein rmd5 homolog a [Phtheirospermum japonicum]
MELNTMQDSFERAAKRQKLSSSKSQELIDQVIHEIKQALTNIIHDNDSVSAISIKTLLTDLRSKLQVAVPLKYLEGLQTELNMNLFKHQKLLEKTLHPDISKACRKVDFDPHVVNQIIITHFYRQNIFNIVDSLITEANEPEAISLRARFQELHEMINAMKKCRDLEPALRWASANRETLEKSGSDIELKIRKLQFVQFLQNRTRADAVSYAKTYLSPFASRRMKDVQKLMCSLLWAGKLDRSPYADLADPARWAEVADEITRLFFNFAGQPVRDPLGLVVDAGDEGLPTLLKLANVMAGKKQEWEEMKQLPVPVELGKEFQFHSVFVCPVSREQSCEENPAMMLPCGHVLCRESINKLSKGSTRGFKCPYCPKGFSSADCKEIFF